jgi:hypothetical protein
VKHISADILKQRESFLTLNKNRPFKKRETDSPKKAGPLKRGPVLF